MTAPGSTVGSPDQPQMTYPQFLEERKAKLALSEDQSKIIDNWILTLGGGALGLTLTFLHDHTTPVEHIILAEIGIGALVFSLLFVLCSLYASQYSISRHIDLLDAWCCKRFMPDQAIESGLLKNPWAGMTSHFNKVAGALFILGVICISWFVVKNLDVSPLKEGDTKTMTTQNNNQSRPPSGPIEKGAVIKPPPPPPPKNGNN